MPYQKYFKELWIRFSSYGFTWLVHGLDDDDDDEPSFEARHWKNQRIWHIRGKRDIWEKSGNSKKSRT